MSDHLAYRAHLAHLAFLAFLSTLPERGAYYSGGGWIPSETGGGGDAVNEVAFRDVAAALKEQDLYAGVRTWQLDDVSLRANATPTPTPTPTLTI